MTDPTAAKRPPTPQRRLDASMTLLREVVERPLDPGYAAAAQRRAAGEARLGSWWAKALVVVVAAVLGLGAVWAARELRLPASDAGDARGLLITQIEKRAEHAEQQRARIAELTGEIERLQHESLRGPDLARRAELEMLGAASGAQAVTGPALILTLDDARDAAAGLPDSRAGLVQDVDLQVVVNGLWATGAEAVAINDHRLTTLTAIRSAGEAILVDLSPVRAPYRVTAIGDPAQMQARLVRSAAGAHLVTLRDNFGISVHEESSEETRLDGSPARTLRYAEVMETPASAPPADPRPGQTYRDPGEGN